MPRVRLTLATPTGPVDVVVRPGTPLRRALRAAGADHTGPWHVGGTTTGADGPVGTWPLLHGALVEPGPAAASALELRVVRGPAVGRRAPLGASAVEVGRHDSCDLVVLDPAASRRHARVELADGCATVTDLATTNGTLLGTTPVDGTAIWPVGELVRIGDTAVELARPPAGGVPRTDDGTVPHRPMPRAVVEPRPVALDRPEPRAAPTDARRRWAVVLAPLLVSGVVAVALHSALLLLLGLTGPLVALVTAWSDRRHGRRAGRAAHRAHEDALRRLDADLATALGRERLAREERAWTTARAVAAAHKHPADLWGGRLAWTPGRGSATATSVSIRGEDPPALADVPVDVPLTPGTEIGVVGPDARAAARALVLQLVTALPPAGLALAVVADGRAAVREWAWADLLPHRRPDLDDGTPADRPALVVVDGPARPAGLDDAVVVLVGEPSAGPTLHAEPGRSTLRLPGLPPSPVVPDLLDADAAWAAARALAPVRDATTGGIALPTRVSLTDLLLPGPPGPDDDTATRVAARWRSRPTLGPVPLGIGPDGAPLLLDLPVDGPHALVGGTTGAGKSELVTSLVTALALTHGPDVVSVLLVDFKGGATAAALARLPHVCDVVTDLDPDGARRALTGLQAELRRRERALADAGATHVDDAPGLARLVIVVDEYRVLAEEHPEFLQGLLRVATTGRSLGVHLVLATQRPAGIVSADVRANVSLRIALRLNDVHDSQDVIDAPDAARLPPSVPGRAVVRRADGTLEPVQVAHAGTPPSALRPDVEVLDAPDNDGPAGGDPLAALVDAARAAADLLGLRRAPSPVPPPLPATVPGADLVAAPGDGLALGLVDLPELQRTDVLRHGPGHLAVVGVARSGRTTALRQVVAAALAGPDPVHVHVVGDAGLVAGFTGPRLGSVVPPQHTRLVLRLLERAREPGPVPRLVVVDGWQRVTAGVDPVLALRLHDALVRLLAEGPGRGTHVVVSGERPLLTGGLAAHLPSRLVLRLADATDLALVGLPPGLADAWTRPGRAVRTDDGAVVQLASPPERLTSGDAPAPWRLRPLPDRCEASPGDGMLGVGGDDAAPVPAPTGDAVLVAGPAGSGRSTAARTLAHAHPGRVVVVGRDLVPRAPDAVFPVPRPATTGDADPTAGPGTRIDPTAPDAAARLEDALSGAPVTVLVDELRDVADGPLDAVLAGAVAARRARVVVVATPDALAGAYRGLAGLLRRSRCGLVLGARVPADGEPLGVRLDVSDEPQPGRGVLVDGHRQTTVQVGLHPTPGDPGAARRLDPGPGA